MADLRELVRAERHRRNWSRRRAANQGGCSNTAWSEWERGTRGLGAIVQQAVSDAFGWRADWPDWPGELKIVPEPPPPDPRRTDDADRVAALEAANEAQAALLAKVLVRLERLEKPREPKLPQASR